MSQMTFLRTYGGIRGANVGPSRNCMFIEASPPRGQYRETMYCGAPSEPGISYCAEHRQRCFREMDKKLQANFEGGYIAYGGK